MANDNFNEYRREYNKSNYKTIKVYIPIEEYEDIKQHAIDTGHKAISGYIKNLIDADMQKEVP